MRKRKNVNIDDLEYAVTWLLSLEDENGNPAESSDSDEEDIQAVKRVAAWIEKEIAKRENRK